MHPLRRPKRSKPPLTWLRSFEAAARHLSFKKAAGELNVTPAAVSQQVRQLEDHYDVRLFVRQSRSIELTRVGSLAAPLIQLGFESISEACDAIHGQRDNDAIVVTVPPSFCAKWLIPRLERFRERHPHVDIRIDARDELVNFEFGWADVGVRYGDGNYPNLHVEPLIADFYCPVCSPRLLEKNGGLDQLSQLSRFRLLHVDWPPRTWKVPSWARWLKAAGVAHGDAERGHRFANEMLAQDAAVFGLGIALVSHANVWIDISRGRLVRVLEHIQPFSRSHDYHIVRAKTTRVSESVTLFCEWLRRESDRQPETFTDSRLRTRM